MVRTWPSVLQRHIAHLIADCPCQTSKNTTPHLLQLAGSTHRENGADSAPPLSQGSSDKKGEKRPHPKGVSGHYNNTNVRISCSTCTTLHLLCILLPPMSLQNTDRANQTSSGSKAQIMNAYDLDSEPTYQISSFAHKTHTNH